MRPLQGGGAGNNAKQASNSGDPPLTQTSVGEGEMRADQDHDRAHRVKSGQVGGCVGNRH